jgi:hypothetical protein
MVAVADLGVFVMRAPGARAGRGRRKHHRNHRLAGLSARACILRRSQSIFADPWRLLSAPWVLAAFGAFLGGFVALVYLARSYKTKSC